MKQCRTFVDELGGIFRTQFGRIIVSAFVLALAECGSSNSINGNWTATLMLSNSPFMKFSVTLAQGRGSTLSVANIAFTQVPACVGIVGGDVEHTFNGIGTLNVTSGAFYMDMGSPPAVGTIVAILQGTLKNNVITRTWTATGNGGLGFGCSVAGFGNFTMKKA
jgi:hypothetical protein